MRCYCGLLEMLGFPLWVIHNLPGLWLAQRTGIILDMLELLSWNPELVLNAWVVLLEENLMQEVG